MERVHQQPPKPYVGRHDCANDAKWQIYAANQTAKEGRTWHADHLLNGVMGWHAADLPSAQ
eukprot:4295943-Lingulodinium_polyedra.AAC.1